MNASRFQGENKLCIPRDSDSSYWTSVCLHNSLDTWNQSSELYRRVCPDQVSKLRLQHHVSGAKGKTVDEFQWHRAVNNPNLNCKTKEVYFGTLPHFLDSSSLFWNAPFLITQAPGALRLPPFWPKAFYLLSFSISSRSTLPKVHQDHLLSVRSQIRYYLINIIYNMVITEKYYPFAPPTLQRSEFSNIQWLNLKESLKRKKTCFWAKVPDFLIFPTPNTSYDQEDTLIVNFHFSSPETSSVFYSIGPSLFLKNSVRKLTFLILLGGWINLF